MRKEWEYFPLDTERPSGIVKYDESQRRVLEQLIAFQVADVLSLYGEVVECEVDNTGNVDADGSQTFAGLRLEAYTNSDGEEIEIGQFPPVSGGVILTEEGAHSVEVCDEDEVYVLGLVVWDPKVNAEKRIHTPGLEEVEIDCLQELHEALIVLGGLWSQDLEVNQVPFETANYPLQVLDLEFQAVIADL